MKWAFVKISVLLVFKCQNQNFNANALTFFLLGDWGKGGSTGAYSSSLNENDEEFSSHKSNNDDDDDDDDDYVHIPRMISKDAALLAEMHNSLRNNPSSEKLSASYNNSRRSLRSNPSTLSQQIKIEATNNNNKKYYQMEVAAAMGAAAATLKPSFVVALGDNFYSNGVPSSTDSLWSSLWKDVYITPYADLNIPWYPVFGNRT